MKRIWIEGEHLLGDYLMQTPAIRGLQVKYPGIQLCYTTSDELGSRELIKHTPGISRVYNPAQSRVLAEKGDLRVGGGAGEAFAVSRQLNCSMAQAWCRMWDVPFDGGWYKIDVPEQYREQPPIRSPFVVLGRHSRSCTSNDPKIRVPNKCLSNDFWIQVANYLLKQNITPVAVGALQDANDQTYWGLPEECVKLYGMPIMQVAGVLQRATFTLSVDTGIRHMAAAVGGNLLTLNSAIPLDIIRCEPQHTQQFILEPQVNIHNTQEAFTQVQPLIEEMLKNAGRGRTPS